MPWFAYRKPNFASIRSNVNNISPVFKNLLSKDIEKKIIFSPSKMVKLLQSTVDKALTKLNTKAIATNKRRQGPRTFRARAISRRRILESKLMPTFCESPVSNFQSPSSLFVGFNQRHVCGHC